MRLRDENKRKLIVETAIRLFSEKPFHLVRLDDVAEAAGVGKGTVYIYFKNKEDLYYTLVYDGFASLVSGLREQVQAAGMSVREKFRGIVAGLVNYAVQHPQLFEVMRTVPIPDSTSPWDVKRQELSHLVEEVIRQGIAAGEFADEHPDQTGLYLPAMVRAVMLFGGKTPDAKALSEHIAGVLLRGIASK